MPPSKGPADKLLAGLGLEVSAYAVAKLYADFLDVFIIDQKDAALADRIRQLGVKVKIANTIMDSAADKVEFGKSCSGKLTCDQGTIYSIDCSIYYFG